MTKFPRDEFDQVPETAARQGVHRERFIPPRSGGPALKIIVGALALIVGIAALFIFPRLGIGTGAESAAEVTVTATIPADTDTGSGAPTTDTSPSDPSTEASATPSPTAEATSSADEEGAESTGGVNKLEPVNVLNGSGQDGLASAAAGRLLTDGWNVGMVGNWTGQPVQGSIVFYNGTDQEANAEELARVLGISTVLVSPEVSPNVTVVLGPGFR